jgi:hypothetical protein
MQNEKFTGGEDTLFPSLILRICYSVILLSLNFKIHMEASGYYWMKRNREGTDTYNPIVMY